MPKQNGQSLRPGRLLLLFDFSWLVSQKMIRLCRSFFAGQAAKK
jgi:hypothetical protein